MEDAQAGISVEPEDPRALADAMLRLWGLSAQERWTRGCNARRYALEHHDLSKLSQRLGEFLARTARQNEPYGEQRKAA